MSSVSVVVPCYNDGAYLAEAVASARAQTHPDLEVVVVDDGSTDPETVRVVAAVEADGVAVVRQANAGLPSARNAGIRACTGDYILPLDADDRIAPEYAALAAAVLDADPEVGIVGGGIEYFGLRTGVDRPTYDGVRGMLFENRLFTSSVTRRSDWELAGGYPDGLGFGEDWVYWLRILSLGRTVHLLDETVWFYRQRAGQMSRVVRPEEVTSTQLFAMRDSPGLYAAHFDLVVDHLEAKLTLLDGFRRRYGWASDVAARLRRGGSAGT